MSELHAIAEVPERSAPPPVEPRLRATIEGFSSVTICKMIPVGMLLALAFDERSAPGT